MVLALWLHICGPNEKKNDKKNVFTDKKNVVHYFDDILVHTKIFDEHITSLGKVLSVLKTNGLTAKPNKTEIAKRSLVFLKHLFEEGHISLDQSNASKTRH